MDQNNQNYWQSENEHMDTAPQASDSKPMQSSPKPAGKEVVIEWQASEYIHYEKGIVWFIVLAAVTLCGVGLAILFRQWFFALLIAVMGITLGIFAKRTPREVNYRMTQNGITIQGQAFPFSQFKSFGMLKEGAFYAVQLHPTRRFTPGIAIYFSETEGEKIFDILVAHLPSQEVHHDTIDKLTRWLRF